MGKNTSNIIFYLCYNTLRVIKEENLLTNELIEAIEEFEKLKGIPKEMIISSLEDAIRIAYKKKFQNSGDIFVNINKETGEIKIFRRAKVVENAHSVKEISIKDAKNIKDNAQIDETIDVEILPDKLGFVAMQVAKQILVQKIVSLERDVIYDEFKDKIGKVLTGKVSRIIGSNIYVKLEKGEGRIPQGLRIPNEEYYVGKELKVYVLDVLKTSRGPDIILSRIDANLLKYLLQREIPEINDGIVEIKGIVREPGKRAKVAVHSYKSEVDPVGACIGTKGVRITNISKELSDEKIDIIRWSDNPKEYIKYALSPAKISRVETFDKKAVVYLPVDQIPLAIGKEGINVKLASKLTGYSIELK